MNDHFFNIENIKDFHFYKNGIVYISGNIRERNVVFKSIDKCEILVNNEIIPTFKVCRDCIIAYSPKKTIVINSAFHVTEYDSLIIKDIIENNCLLADKIVNNNDHYLCYYDVKNDIIKWILSETVYFRLVYNDKIFCEKTEFNKHFISAIQINTGSDIWNFPVFQLPNYINGFGREQEADIKQIIGVYNNILWIHAGGFRLIGIDVETGKQMHYVEDMAYHMGLTKEERRYFDFSPWGNGIHLDERTGLLKAFAHRYYIEINLNTLRGKVKKDFGKDWKTSWRIKNSIYYQEYPNLLFFSGYYKNMDKQPNVFGIFDTEKAEIVWYDIQKDDLGYFYTPPQANDKLLAILDDKHNLLVYERKEIENKCMQDKMI